MQVKNKQKIFIFGLYIFLKMTSKENFMKKIFFLIFALGLFSGVVCAQNETEESGILEPIDENATQEMVEPKQDLPEIMIEVEEPQ